MGGEGAVLGVELERARRAGNTARAVILVEGTSDKRAVAALAGRQGRDLAREGVAVIATTGATNFARFLEVLGPGGHDVALAGLCDEGETADLHRALISAGVGERTDPLEDLGFFVCRRDLEDELIRALGAETMIRLIESQRHLRRFRSFQSQPAQRHKTVDQQLRRWLGNHKIRYAPLMVEALDDSLVPLPLEALLDAV
jgi:hypothetical protein